MSTKQDGDWGEALVEKYLSERGCESGAAASARSTSSPRRTACCCSSR